MPLASPHQHPFDQEHDAAHKEGDRHHHRDRGGGQHGKAEGQEAQNDHDDAFGLGQAMQPALLLSPSLLGNGGGFIVGCVEGRTGGHGDVLPFPC